MRVTISAVAGWALVYAGSLCAQTTPPPIVRTRPNAYPPAPIYRPIPRTETFGLWKVEPFGKGYSAYIGNGSGSVFGVYCNNGCTAYLNAKTSCDAKADYPALVNSSAGAYSVVLRCAIVDDRYLLAMPVDDTLIQSFEIGGELGIAFPLASGQFQVARFSLTGANAAANRAATLAGAAKGEGKESLKDYRI